METVYRVGIPEFNVEQAAALYDEAFAEKLAPAIPDMTKRLAVLTAAIQPARAVAALRNGDLVGLAGFHDQGGSFTGGLDFNDLTHILGFWGGVRAALVLLMLNRHPEPGEMLMDGIAVRADSRGQGIGRGLFAALEDVARDAGYESLRLEVVDTNPDARRLYERLGFEATRTERTPYLQKLMGFAAATTMVKSI